MSVCWECGKLYYPQRASERVCEPCKTQRKLDQYLNQEKRPDQGQRTR